MNVHASPAPPVAVVDADVSSTFSPYTVSKVTFKTVFTSGAGIGSTSIVCPAVAPKGTSIFLI